MADIDVIDRAKALPRPQGSSREADQEPRLEGSPIALELYRGSEAVKAT
jgi:hypothetical protein